MTKLTRRQQDVCALVVIGKRSKEISRYLGMSIRTVDDHRRKIFMRYGVRNAVELTLAVHGINDLCRSRSIDVHAYSESLVGR